MELKKKHTNETKSFFNITARASRALTLTHFKLDILQDSEPPHKKAQNTFEFETMLCSTLLKIMTVCSVLTENASSAHKSSSNDWNHFQKRIA